MCEKWCQYLGDIYIFIQGLWEGLKEAMALYMSPALLKKKKKKKKKRKKKFKKRKKKKKKKKKKKGFKVL